MPGETLLGECARWTPDAALLNCDPEDPNEPFDDAFDGRAEDCECGAWFDMNQEVIGEFGEWLELQMSLVEADVSIRDYFRLTGASDFFSNQPVELEDDGGVEVEVSPVVSRAVRLTPREPSELQTAVLAERGDADNYQVVRVEAEVPPVVSRAVLHLPLCHHKHSKAVALGDDSSHDDADDADSYLGTTRSIERVACSRYAPYVRCRVK